MTIEDLHSACSGRTNRAQTSSGVNYVDVARRFFMAVMMRRLISTALLAIAATLMVSCGSSGMSTSEAHDSSSTTLSPTQILRGTCEKIINDSLASVLSAYAISNAEGARAIRSVIFQLGESTDEYRIFQSVFSQTFGDLPRIGLEESLDAAVPLTRMYCDDLHPDLPVTTTTSSPTAKAVPPLPEPGDQIWSPGAPTAISPSCSGGPIAAVTAVECTIAAWRSGSLTSAALSFDLPESVKSALAKVPSPGSITPLGCLVVSATRMQGQYSWTDDVTADCTYGLSGNQIVIITVADGSVGTSARIDAVRFGIR